MKRLGVFPTFFRKSYFRKYVLVLAVLLASMVGVGLYTEEQVSGELASEKHDELRTIAELEAENLNEWVDTNEQRARMLSEHRGLQSDDPDSVDQSLLREHGQLPSDVYAIHYVDLETGDVVRSTAGEMETKSLDDVDITWQSGELDFSQSTDVAVSEVYRNGGLQLVAFASPVPGTDRAVLLITDATQHAKAFREPVERSHTQVVREDGTVLFDRYGKNVLTAYRDGDDTPGLDAAVAATDDKSGVVERAADEQVVAYAPVKGTDWYVLVQAPRENVFTLLTQVQNHLTVLIGTAVAGFILMGLTLGRSTVVSLRRLRKRAERLADGDMDVDLSSRRVDEFGTLYNSFAEMRDTLQRRIEESEETAATLERAADEYGETMDQAAAGDLTARMDPDAAGDAEAMAEIGRRFNRMMDEWEETVAEVGAFAERAAAASERVGVGTDEVSNASQQVSRSTQEITSGAADQLDTLQAVSDQTADLSATVEEIAAQADELSTLSKRAAERGDEGREAAMAVGQEMAEIADQAETVTARVSRLDEEVSDIASVVDLIDDIAEQTNILALNASIEASRAGEAGEGFAVVANEVKQLAEETAAATDDIGDSIESVRRATTEAVEEMDEMQSSVESGAETIDGGVDAIREAVDIVEDVDHGVHSIDEATDSQATATQQAAERIDDAASIAAQTHSESEQVAAAAQQQTASLETVADEVDELAEQTQVLAERVETFTVSDDVLSADGDHGSETDAVDTSAAETTPETDDSERQTDENGGSETDEAESETNAIDEETGGTTPETDPRDEATDDSESKTEAVDEADRADESADSEAANATTDGGNQEGDEHHD
ncbi:methyl-accepting chemotaxis protein [Halogeometricum borinquense DSM 11551]|uniref:Methyl-accepting chemotaxis protein n=1 Tax=Halogeometricum borinquense (strain ATCC 700274 / DSM 11551 / JCM 10706 / KCTC 4070 / PR3) TaxID=469382 RepID=E4NN22_HALBP|nr:methyl-accepting chemotaxis protein [Halogeometricum borinquense]ADQ66252.1 methyl-accepting chemotaxis protein [Halogeometricum borinquense DSM 11551]ELY27252.1 methyl-accepting chemotaxis protein [Halogeometricum borinquense DSM 11551]